jgi:lipopolysaccharide export system permease protein
LTIIARYMYSRLILGTLGVMAILATMQILYKTHDLYRLVIASVISVRELLIVWATLLPVIFYHVSPEMVTIAVLARYYLWRQDNELLTQRSMGRSSWQIAFPGIAVGICTGLFAASMSLYVLPASIGTAEKIKSAAEHRVTPSMLDEGVQNHLLPEVSISFQSWRAADVIESVVVTDERAPDKFTFVIAERGRFVRTDGVYVLVLENGNSFTYSGAPEEVQRVSFNELSIPLSNPADRAPQRGMGFYASDIGTLLNPPDDVRQDRRVWAASVTEGHHRIVNPLRCIGCVLLVLGILVPGHQGKTGLIVRLGLALSLSFAENTASTIAFAAAQRHLEGAPLLYLLPGLSGGLGAALLCWGDMRLDRWSRWTRLWGKGAPGAKLRYSTGATLAPRASLE